MTTDNLSKHVDTIYLDGLEHILNEGTVRGDRTGTGTKSVFGTQQRYDLRAGFPLLTTKRIYTKGVFGELLFFLTGRTDNKWLNDRQVTIWDEWQDETGDLGPVYGYQWRFFGAEYVSQADRDRGVHPGGVDQIAQLLKGLKENPWSRRHMVSAWNPEQVDQMALPPCHTMFQFYVHPDSDGNPYGLSCQLYQRSMDYGLGCPFNIASYAALTHLVADLVGLTPVEFVHTTGDSHIYLNHLDTLTEQLSRRSDIRPMPTLKIKHPVPLEELDFSDPSIFEHYQVSDFVVSDYSPHPAIKLAISV